MNVVPKVKNYVWRLATNAVAVKGNLIRRGMLVGPGCPVCGEDDTWEHMVLGCKWTEQICIELQGIRRAETHDLDVTRWLDERWHEQGGT